jgi:hypothetical protein
MKILVAVDWIGDGKTIETAFRPKLVDDFQGVPFSNVSGRFGETKSVIEVECDAQTKAAIELAYGVGAVTVDGTKPTKTVAIGGGV